jgi:hypothetical protein
LHFCFDEREPKIYFVYPPQPATGMGYVEILRAENPVNCTLADYDGVATGAADSDLTLADEYVNDLGNYLRYRAHSKETEAGSTQKAVFYLQAFGQSLGVQELAEQKVEPRKGKTQG